jgi:hypothetical protein
MSEFVRQIAVWIGLAAVAMVVILYVARNRQPPN